MRTGALLGTLMVVCLLSGSACPARGDDGPVVVDSFGTWDLERLGFGDRVIHPRRSVGRISVPYALPVGASQGPRNWYEIRMHYRIRFAPSSGDGLAYLSASTNGRTAAQIEFETPGDRDRPRIRSSSLGMIDGEVKRTFSSTAVEDTFANYLQYAGVRPGKNELTFQIEQYGGAKVEGVRVFADSGVRRTTLDPARLKLGASLPEGPVYVGKTFTVRYALKNAGERPAKKVAVAAVGSSRDLEAVGRKVERVEPIENGETATGSFDFRPRRAGSYAIDLGVDSTSNHPGARIGVTATSAAGARPTAWTGGHLAPGLAFLGGTVSLLLRRTRKRKRTRRRATSTAASETGRIL